jgi:hypothetical protein
MGRQTTGLPCSPTVTALLPAPPAPPPPHSHDREIAPASIALFWSRHSVHTYATHLYQASGGDLEIVQEHLGHASIKTTTIYAKVTKADKAQAAEALAKAYRDSQRNSTTGASSTKRRP